MFVLTRCFIKYGFAVGLTLLHFILIHECKDINNYAENNMSTENPPVELTAVLINCEVDDTLGNPDNEATRFEREELFKHNALRDCIKKLAVTVKICSEPTISKDEFVPIDHVLEGPSRRPVRLLEPYVLRLRRDALLQAYKLRLVDTVRGVLKMPDELKSDELQELDTPTKKVNTSTLLQRPGRRMLQAEYYIRPNEVRPDGYEANNLRSPPIPHILDEWDSVEHFCGVHHIEMCVKSEREYEHTLERFKREEHEQNVVIEPESDQNVLQDENYNLYRNNKQHNRDGRMFERPVKTLNNIVNEQDFETSETYHNLKDQQRNIFSSGKAKVVTVVTKENIARSHLNSKHNPTAKHTSEGRYKGIVVDGSERDFALYEIGSPDLWFQVHAQLFEKVSTDKGNTLWNDITKGEFVSVSSLRPQWSGRDVTVQYRAADAAARDEFALPGAGLCLLAPLSRDPLDDSTSSTDADNYPRVNDLNYIVVPSEDVVSVENNAMGKNSLVNVSSDDKVVKGRCKRVVVRVARALWNFMEEDISIATDGPDKYLTMVHRRPHRALVDLEVRADGNQLVRVGSSGRVAVVVVDSTRRSRSTITVQATNTGLAAARFRAQLRDCDSGLLELVKQKGGETKMDAGLLPPRHTRRLQLELPVELPSEFHHCSVSLMNDNDESVAVRDVVLRRRDRCFCVWHCDCICFDENPRLSCQEMSPARQAAAGLPARRRARLARSACYRDRVPVNIVVTTIGVFVALLIFGFLKGVIGLFFPSVAVWGLDCILQTPRRLDHYYESSLRSRPVQYDGRGWPVHPDTGERSVQVVSKLTSLMLNTIFFVVTPSLLLLAMMRRIVKGKTNGPTDGRRSSGVGSKGDLHTQSQMSRPRRRRRVLRRWMTPHADRLTSNLWQTDLTVATSQGNCLNYARPLLAGARGCGGGRGGGRASDSEQDDTVFVLKHMQKSAESISKTQRNPNMPTNPSTTSH